LAGHQTPFLAIFWVVGNNGKVTRGLQKGVVKSAQSEEISLQRVRESLLSLEKIGAIRKEDEVKMMSVNG
jgi:hypothetical protein